MKSAWEIGVNAQARIPIGSPVRGAGRSGVGTGVGVGVGLAAPGALPGEDAPEHATTRRLSAMSSRGPAHARSRGPPWVRSRRLRVKCCAVLVSTDRVVPARMPWRATSDATCSHPAAADEAVALDGLLRVAGARRLVAAAGGQPAEHDSIQLDEADADPTRHPC